MATRFSRNSPKKPVAAPSSPITWMIWINRFRTSATSCAISIRSPICRRITFSTAATTKSASKFRTTRDTRCAPVAATSPAPAQTRRQRAAPPAASSNCCLVFLARAGSLNESLFCARPRSNFFWLSFQREALRSSTASDSALERDLRCVPRVREPKNSLRRKARQLPCRRRSNEHSAFCPKSFCMSITSSALLSGSMVVVPTRRSSRASPALTKARREEIGGRAPHRVGMSSARPVHGWGGDAREVHADKKKVLDIFPYENVLSGHGTSGDNFGCVQCGGGAAAAGHPELPCAAGAACGGDCGFDGAGAAFGLQAPTRVT